MSIRIDQEKCIGCLKCAAVCPGGLLKARDGKVFMKYPKNCWGCASCLKECSVSAIDFYLGADIGGNGSKMNVTFEGDILYWNIRNPDGSVNRIKINRRNSNKY